ncbi:MAG: DUF4783 domain-containing protein [Ignavibacteria bacterium]|nr:DUF4783 domain-containing protein [Ignavibacteria bacterium]
MHKKSYFIFFFLIILTLNAFSQDKWWNDKKYPNNIKYKECKLTFENIASGFKNYNIDRITRYFDSEVYLDLLGFDAGYYSVNQAEQILIDFLDYFSIINFYYVKSFVNVNSAFAIGYCVYTRNSTNIKINASISLKYKETNWYLEQIILN